MPVFFAYTRKIDEESELDVYSKESVSCAIVLPSVISTMRFALLGSFTRTGPASFMCTMMEF